MKTTLKNFVLLVAFSYVIQTGISCAAGVVAAAFIPLLGALWFEEKNSDHKFFFKVKTPDSNTSEFTGNEDLGGLNGTADFAGSFTNHDLQFTYVAGASKKGTYKGYINDASKEIKLTSDDATPKTMTLIKF
jgi:hypothetical protein